MRSATLFLVSCILMSFVLNQVKDVEGGVIPMSDRKDIFAGGCGSNGSKTCINDFVKKGGASNRPASCQCNNFGVSHLCLCKFAY
ncbi:unnamed protein product [Thlaspi arvense]|uniref:Uncharacterized protein n=1 Tax=Thlaspi arvense TaxID=13288 RepID=A0AAU9T4J9_THLAR|nr:unnamed protein product [Thlaspi arvense]